MPRYQLHLRALLSALATVACVATGAATATAATTTPAAATATATLAATVTPAVASTPGSGGTTRPTQPPARVDRAPTDAEANRPGHRAPLPVPLEPPPATTATVYLTFDHGPGPSFTAQVLAALAEYHAQATFFMIGRQAQANPGLVAAVRAGGHAVGNHTYSHPWLTGLSNTAIAGEISSASTALGGTRCLRPPGGFIDGRVRSVAAQQGQSVVMWSVDPQDWRRPGAGAIASTVLANTRDGSIVLMHDGGGDRSQSVAALRTILSTLAGRGFAFRALPHCL